jgi:Na+/phosphate symporter
MDQIDRSWQSIIGRREANGQPIEQYRQAHIDTYRQSVENLAQYPQKIKNLTHQLGRYMEESERYQCQQQESHMLEKIVDRSNQILHRIITDEQRPLSTAKDEWEVHYRIKNDFQEQIERSMPIYQEELKTMMRYFYQPVQQTHRNAAPSRSASSRPAPSHDRDDRPSWLS